MPMLFLAVICPLIYLLVAGDPLGQRFLDDLMGRRRRR